MRLLLIGGVIGVVIGGGLAVFYFSLATFFTVQEKALEAAQKEADGGNAIVERRSAGDRRQAEVNRDAEVNRKAEVKKESG